MTRLFAGREYDLVRSKNVLVWYPVSGENECHIWASKDDMTDPTFDHILAAPPDSGVGRLGSHVLLFLRSDDKTVTPFVPYGASSQNVFRYLCTTSGINYFIHLSPDRNCVRVDACRQLRRLYTRGWLRTSDVRVNPAHDGCQETARQVAWAFRAF